MSLFARLGGAPAGGGPALASGARAEGAATPGGGGFSVCRWSWDERGLVLAGCSLAPPSGREGPLPAVTGALAQLGREALPGSTCFLDTETTGLGAGALAFMVGIAHIDGPRVVVEQWCLEQLSSEPAMLAAVAERLEGRLVVTFNGSSFDLPLLEARARRWGRGADAFARARAGQLDLVHPARRLSRERTPDCRLQTLEREWLGLARQGDIAGEEIPERFYDALESGPGLLEPVREHNALDVCSLVLLLAELGRRLGQPRDLEEALRVARMAAASADGSRARELLERWVVRGLGAPTSAPTSLRDAGLLLAKLRRAAGDLAGAGQLFRALVERFPGDPGCCEALAKHLEHRAGDLEGALRVTRASRLPDPHREARLMRRLGGRRADEVAPAPGPRADAARGPGAADRAGRVSIERPAPRSAASAAARGASAELPAVFRRPLPGRHR